MQLKLANAEQFRIADLLWAADSMDEVQKIVNEYGHDGQVVYELMTAAVFDDVESTDEAQNVLGKFQRS